MPLSFKINNILQYKGNGFSPTRQGKIIDSQSVIVLLFERSPCCAGDQVAHESTKFSHRHNVKIEVNLITDLGTIGDLLGQTKGITDLVQTL